MPESCLDRWASPVETRCFDFVAQIQFLLGDFSSTIIQSRLQRETNRILFLANQTLDNKFNVLGSGWTSERPMSWNKDLKTDQQWPEHLFYLRQRVQTPERADIKEPWELSRGHFLLWLGEAYLMTGDERYAEKIVELIDHWIEHNPLMYTVNWTCSMEVAIRAVNWMYAINMIVQSKAMTEAFAKRVSKSLYQHGFYIRHNLEKSVPWSNNHYTSDLVGLIYLGTLFSHTRRGRSWRRFAVKKFYDQTRKQILPSGVHYEKSISYHRLMVELTAYPLAMLKRTGESIPEDIIIRVQRMYDYVGSYLKPSGYAPLLADNDDGRFLPFTFNEFGRHGYLLNPESIDSQIVNIGIGPMFKLHYSGEGNLYSDAGIAILKEYGTYLLVNNSGYSKHIEDGKRRVGTHTHNDQLSFEFSIGEDDIIIDPGTYLYTSSIRDRNEFRSTRKHNTAMVDGEEQNFLSEKSAFSMDINNCERKISVNGNVCKGSYVTIKGGLKHERIFEISEGRLAITDCFDKSGNNHKGLLCFHLSDRVSATMNNNGAISIESAHYTISVSTTISGAKTAIVGDTYSPSYGVLRPSQTIESKFGFDNKCKIGTIIEWKKK